MLHHVKYTAVSMLQTSTQGSASHLTTLTQVVHTRHYIISDNQIKLAAGWLIDNAGWKGKTFEGKSGKYGVHKNQALVLVNYGGASGKDILELSNQIIDDIKSKYDVELEREVNIV